VDSFLGEIDYAVLHKQFHRAWHSSGYRSDSAHLTTEDIRN